MCYAPQRITELVCSHRTHAITNNTQSINMLFWGSIAKELLHATKQSVQSLLVHMHTQ